MCHKLGFTFSPSQNTFSNMIEVDAICSLTKSHLAHFKTVPQLKQLYKRFRDLFHTHGLNLTNSGLPLFYMVINSDSTISETDSLVQEFSTWTEMSPR